MQLATYHYTNFHKIVIPACPRMCVFLAGDEEGPELLVFWSDEKPANDPVYDNATD